MFIPIFRLDLSQQSLPKKIWMQIWISPMDFKTKVWHQSWHFQWKIRFTPRSWPPTYKNRWDNVEEQNHGHLVLVYRKWLYDKWDQVIGLCLLQIWISWESNGETIGSSISNWISSKLVTKFIHQKLIIALALVWSSPREKGPQWRVENEEPPPAKPRVNQPTNVVHRRRSMRDKKPQDSPHQFINFGRLRLPLPALRRVIVSISQDKWSRG